MEDKKPDANVDFPLPRAEKYVANEGRGYCQKLPRESIWRQKTRAAPKEVQHVPLTSAQVVGWRPPIDNLMSPHMGQSTLNRSGICWRTFHDNGHLGGGNFAV